MARGRHASSTASSVSPAIAVAREMSQLRKATGARSTDPVEYAWQVFGMRLWPRQAEITRAVSRHKRVAVRSGHKVSKSHTCALLAIWWVDTHARGRVVITAPGNTQIRTIVWRELRYLASHSTRPLPQPAQLPAVGMQWPDGREIIGFSTSEAERIAGQSGPEMLFIVDEASGVEEYIYEALEGNRAGGAHILLVGNPTKPVGTFYDAFHSKSAFWETLHISSLEAAAHEPHIPGLAEREWCEEKLREWGEHSPLYQVRVLGEFASRNEASVIALEEVVAARRRHEDGVVDKGALLCIGVDPARFGEDHTAIAATRGARLVQLTTHHGLETTSVVSEVLLVLDRLRVPGEKPAHVKVDTVGLGAGVADVLRAKNAENLYMVEEVNASERADADGEYTNLRAELWFALADWLRTGAIPADDWLDAELLSPQYDFDNRGRRRVEPKKDVKKRLGRSPDRADALALAVYRPGQPLVMPQPAGTKPAYLDLGQPADTTRWLGMGRGY